MKFEKREITLNEYDSVLDILFTHERLASLYFEGARFVNRKEARELLKKRLSETLDEIYFLNDLLDVLRKQQV